MSEKKGELEMCGAKIGERGTGLNRPAMASFHCGGIAGISSEVEAESAESGKAIIYLCISRRRHQYHAHTQSSPNTISARLASGWATAAFNILSHSPSIGSQVAPRKAKGVRVRSRNGPQ